MTSLQALRATTDAATAETKRLQERKKCLLVLIKQYLLENGYIEAAERLQHEGGSALSKLAVADNVDLMLILQEYESYYEMRFDKKPKLIRKVEGDASSLGVSTNGSSSTKKGVAVNSKKKENSSITDGQHDSQTEVEPPVMAITGNSYNVAAQSSATKPGHQQVDDLNSRSSMPSFGGDAELRVLAATISRDILQEHPNVPWTDIVDLEDAKRLLREAVALPLRYPALFQGLLRPWRGVLLHGPPGTGKTLLAKAVATECRTTFFNISAATLVSKWRGDSEKLVRVLFELARHRAPSTIFLDETDAILAARDGEGGSGEHEASRRMRTELLIQMDGLASDSHGGPPVFVLAASNAPWALDPALLRRLEKRVHVPLPTASARQQMLRRCLADRLDVEVGVDQLVYVAQRLEGYSGADIKTLCREAAMRPLRRLLDALDHLSPVTEEILPPGARDRGRRPIKAPSAPDVDSLLRQDPVTLLDLEAALSQTRPSVDSGDDRYYAWQRDHGAI